MGILHARVDDAVTRYVAMAAQEKELPASDVVKELLRIGMENRKEVSDRLEKKRKLALEILRYEDATEEIKHELRRAHLLENFRKLTSQIRHKDLATRDKIRVVRSALKRIEDVLGRDSDEFKEALKWSRLDESDSTTPAEKDSTIESARKEKPATTKPERALSEQRTAPPRSRNSAR